MDASRFRVLRWSAPAVASSLVVLLGGCTGSAPAKQDGPTHTRTVASRTNSDLQGDYQRVIKNVLPSVVQIRAGEGLGSGVVYDDQGHIVTNAHVVGSSRTFQVTTANSEHPLTAHLIYSYPAQDLAVVKLDTLPHGLKAAAFGDSTKVEVGQIVLAMGSPLGLSSSVTQGIVSATGRTVSEGSTDGATGATIANMVQTSAAINPGNSGGALVNLDSEVIGIPTLAAVDPGFGNSAAPGIGFAIPANMVKTIADQIIAKGRVTHSGRAALGITGRTLVNVGSQPVGVAVVDVQHGGAADKAGLRAGDVIVKLGDREITTITSLSEALAGDKPGQRTTVTYLRGGDRKTADVTLSEQ
ncbi:trypsin-like peptidase domain-containing protein [Streptomyces sp. RY43-2]|uniref:Trypsin-like peptidase domain-containing protein n=1 Tax=Streptomyces macrolidinus TaxID=2952607 RepID=A0ABT0Z9I8_9ACTN|nr:trypsin-like peptidase domain-containing protein [Streptomyces macrolidinus]MCN9239864.1 trypsin-like peptidase domain-containing protein [Streptomyces macrolidinus]